MRTVPLVVKILESASIFMAPGPIPGAVGNKLSTTTVIEPPPTTLASLAIVILLPAKVVDAAAKIHSVLEFKTTSRTASIVVTPPVTILEKLAPTTLPVKMISWSALMLVVPPKISESLKPTPKIVINSMSLVETIVSTPDVSIRES